MTDAEIEACRDALKAAEQAVIALRAVLRTPSAGHTGELVSLGKACQTWGISKDAGLKRVKRHKLGIKIGGRWQVPTFLL